MNIYIDQNYLIDFEHGHASEPFLTEKRLADDIVASRKHRFVVSA